MDVLLGVKKSPVSTTSSTSLPARGLLGSALPEKYWDKSLLQPRWANLCTSFGGNSHVFIFHGIVFVAPRDPGGSGCEWVGRGCDRAEAGGQGLHSKTWSLQMSLQSTFFPLWCESPARACSEHHPRDVAHPPGWRSSAPGPPQGAQPQGLPRSLPGSGEVAGGGGVGVGCSEPALPLATGYILWQILPVSVSWAVTLEVRLVKSRALPCSLPC